MISEYTLSLVRDAYSGWQTAPTGDQRAKAGAYWYAMLELAESQLMGTWPITPMNPTRADDLMARLFPPNEETV